MRTQLLMLLALIGISVSAFAAQPLVIHEWGTFTALQDDNGVSLGRINTDDEPVPAFVHKISNHVLEEGHPLALSIGRRLTEQDASMLRYGSKGFPARHPLVTLRLETPVLYFYPPAGDDKPFNIDVKASFKGGWLTEFYPKAVATAPGMDIRSGWWNADIPISRDTVGSLEWKSLTINASSMLPKTDWHVWLAPRNTSAAQLVSASGESEKYLFYRGVGNRASPISVRNDRATGMLAIQKTSDGIHWKGQRVPALWLLDVRADGKAAWRSVKTEAQAEQSTESIGSIALVQSDFEDGEYQTNGVEALRKEMHTALVKDGLFGDEATAMLSTWQRAYFESFGKRVFFVVPRAWTDEVLPLEVSLPAQITRSMIGRVELVGENQRALLKQLRTTEASDPRWLMKVPYNEKTQKFLSRQTPFGEMTLPDETPADYKLYMQLGRFRSAIVLNDQERNPSPQLAEFIKRYGIASPREVFNQILNERPAADLLQTARAELKKDLVGGYKALYALLAEFSDTEASREAEREISELWQVRANRAKLAPVRPACLLSLLKYPHDMLRAKALFDQYPNSPEAAEAKARIAAWERERAEAEKEARDRAAAQN